MPSSSPTSKRGQKSTDAHEQVESYFASLAPDARRELQSIRDTIAAAAPDAAESFSYNMPAFMLGEQPLTWYAAWKQHYSLYPISESIACEHAADLTNYESAKGTIRFSRKEPLPLALVARLVSATAAELRQG
jgi:uncharacterized protein YdhG (YjbR/CyaY superfamily)